MTFQQLYYITEIFKCGSINKAAQKLFVSQSGLSASVKELEDELNAKIFLRTNKGTEFTQKGREFLRYATSLLNQKEVLENLFRKPNACGSEDYLTLSTQHFAFVEQTFLSLFSESYDSGHFSMFEKSFSSIIEDVSQFKSDLGIISFPSDCHGSVESRLTAAELEYTVLSYLKPYVCTHKEHPLTLKPYLAINDLSFYPYAALRYSSQPCTKSSGDYCFPFLKSPSKTLSFNSYEAMKAALLTTQAFSICTKPFLIRDSGLIFSKLEDCNLELVAIKPKGSRLSKSAEDFLTALRIRFN